MAFLSCVESCMYSHREEGFLAQIEVASVQHFLCFDGDLADLLRWMAFMAWSVGCVRDWFFY